MATTKIILFIAALASLAAGCWAPRSTRPADDEPHIALRRGGRWSVLTIAPPYLNGPSFQLVLRDHVLSGSISGETAPGGALHVRIDDDGASGRGPHGPVAMDFESKDGATVVEGFWNGQRVYFELRGDSLTGTVADNTAAGRFEPASRNSSCSYDLDEMVSPGSVRGASTCEGLHQPTALEISRATRALLSRGELLTVLVTVLSAPPLSASEAPGRSLDLSPEGEGFEMRR